MHQHCSTPRCGTREAERCSALQNMKKILIVEDNTDSMEIMTRSLKEDYLIVKAYNGKEGLEKAILEKPDLILMDISLPVMDGLMVIQSIRRTKEIQAIPIFVVSASAMSQQVKEAMDSGCNDFVAKPVRPGLLREKVKEYVQG